MEIVSPLDTAYVRAQEVLREDMIDPLVFADLYGQDNVERDLMRVKRWEEQFAERATPEDRENAKLAAVLEAVVHDGVRTSKWFGDQVSTIKTSRFDDIVNGVDAAIEFQRGDRSASYMALAFDVTYSKNISEKLLRIRDEVRSGDLTRIKYFESNFLGMRGEMSGVPRVVVGGDRQSTHNVARSWVQGEDMRHHLMRDRVLLETRVQVEAFERFARVVCKNPDVASVYERALSDLDRTIEGQSIRKNALDGDRVSEEIAFWVGHNLES
ncbi:MAG: hypothetical protein AAB372_00945 [Patescibacteria group bacterium]